ncbi:hypothetical protein [uncultured Bifidobacterium sp.]|uniref:hypothetical protein n=1 Tax=uncultured Bifidobacterium sp. TaxID=165187 RepID=UPI00258455C7|nr:hypothetical protein [uncultured Bifidobacterium sp.]
MAPRPTHLGKASQSAQFVWRARPTAQAGSPAEAGTARQSRSGKLTIPDLINIGVFSALYFALVADLIAKAGKYSSKIGILISYVVFANINTGTS